MTAPLLHAQAPAPAPAPVPAPAGGELPTVEQLQQQLATDAPGVLRGVAKLLALKGQAATQVDRHALFMLRGEAALRTKAYPMAIDSFTEAGKVAGDDEPKRSAARAMELLTRRAKPTGYAVKTAAKPTPTTAGSTLTPAPGAAPSASQARPGASLPFIEPADRKAAFAALLSDELAAAEPKIRAARSATTMAPIIDVARMLGDLRAVEVAATGDGEQVKSIAGDVGKRASTLIGDAVTAMQGRSEQIWKEASELQWGRDGEYYNQVMRGLTSRQREELKDIQSTCEKIAPLARDLAAVTADPQIEQTIGQAQKVHARAQQVLEFDYPNLGRPTGARRETRTGVNPPIQRPPQPRQKP